MVLFFRCCYFSFNSPPRLEKGLKLIWQRLRLPTCKEQQSATITPQHSQNTVTFRQSCHSSQKESCLQLQSPLLGSNLESNGDGEKQILSNQTANQVHHSVSQRPSSKCLTTQQQTLTTLFTLFLLFWGKIGQSFCHQ